MEVFYENARIWQTVFEVTPFIPDLIRPQLVVEEHRDSPRYINDGRLRENVSGGQFVITLSGRGVIRIDGEEFSLTPGRTFLHVHSDPAICYFYPRDGKEEWRFLWMSLEGAHIKEIIYALVTAYGYLYDVPLDGKLVEILKSFRCEDKELRFLAPLEAAELAATCLNLLCRSRVQEQRGSMQSQLVRRVQMLLASDFSQSLSSAELARRFGVSREHLSRTFRQETQIPLKKYVTRLRMTAAAEMLLQTRLSVKEVASRCGYSDYAVFFRTFKLFFECAPQKYRLGNVTEIRGKK